MKLDPVYREVRSVRSHRARHDLSGGIVFWFLNLVVELRMLHLIPGEYMLTWSAYILTLLILFYVPCCHVLEFPLLWCHVYTLPLLLIRKGMRLGRERVPEARETT